MRPYGLIENVVTHSDFRQQGYGSAILEQAVQCARENNCYKVMLLTGSKLEATLKFYEQAGFNRKDKTGLVRWL
jgi:GNAT superfamily N-acetyltransferase